MKNKIITSYFVAAFLIGSLLKADAQKLEYGIRFMPTFSAFKIYTPTSGIVKGNVSFGYGVEHLFAYNFTKRFALQAEFLYSDLSLKYKEADAERKIHLRYINIPILFSVNTNRYKTVNVNIVVGPQVGFLVESNIRTLNGDRTNNPNAVLLVKTGDLGLAYGAGIDFGLNKSRCLRLGLGFRGTYGLIDISDHKVELAESYYLLNRTHVKTYSAYISLSFLFGKKG